ncbi:HlyD family type I secretion periplasmic adaptor subunit [Maritimibacter sp. 55A14]|uniref:HlyD family type I secretion periplasmic adaptor subunit n=1 Tax=Maritimibacter sp. 55A14 TaxID=2174844 RepID=UPI000D61901E|nr:HlyD family type I secretion periplasmic adaptor subunit [Maritimibacter sp. 55A14]PWE32651.1 HlyD family type I secretion periplasmic adaptor subunit [Maritimibacter sp. 55A14]
MNVARTWPARAPLLLGLAAMAALLGGFGAWSAGARIAGAVIAPGRLEVERNRQVVQHPDGGVADRILVEEGDFVEAGQLLLRLDSTQMRSELTIVEDWLFELAARRGRLLAERDGRPTVAFDAALRGEAARRAGLREMIDGQRRLHAARALSLARETAQLGKRQGQIASQRAGLAAQRGALAAQIELIGEELSGQQTLLDKGLAERPRVLSLRREAARLEGRDGELAAADAELQGRATEIALEVLKLRSTRREAAIAELRDLRAQEMELAERRRALTGRLSRLDIRAPAAGFVHGLTVSSPGAVIRPAETVLRIVPQDRPLIIAAEIATAHVDEVRVGQEVRLRFPSLGGRRSPELRGRVTKLSVDAFTDSASGRAFYRAEIMPLEGEWARLSGIDPLPGMPVEAYLSTAERSPLAYLVRPLTDYFTRAFREP